jgi:hypothetical protein
MHLRFLFPQGMARKTVRGCRELEELWRADGFHRGSRGPWGDAGGLRRPQGPMGHRRTTRGGHGLPKVSPGPAMSYCHTLLHPVGGPTLKRPNTGVCKGSALGDSLEIVGRSLRDS